ncbi:HNH endonuclease [Streptomyces sp. NPDC059708]|uniref:HNH endonuclease n=1 Tax=Streptomyces sp. NPDC059708 TaxID=3346916 RepID=UPI00369DC891
MSANRVHRPCGVTGCQRPHRRNGLCDTHDQRMKRTGTTDDPPKQTLADRFWAKVDRNGPGDCWLWTAATNEHGYGVMRPTGQRSGPTVKAHRVSLTLSGVDVEGFVVLHACDNPPCVNPAHLSVGTKADNSADMVSRDRHARGSRSGTSKLTEQQVLEIRARCAAGELHRALAVEYGVSRVAITNIVTRKTWRHVTTDGTPQDSGSDITAAAA